MDLNYRIGIDILHKKAEKAVKSLDVVMRQKFQSMTNYNKRFNRETLLSQRLSRQLIETETMGLAQMQKFYGPIITNKKKMTNLSGAWHKSESKSLKEVTSLMKLNKTEQLGYLRRIGASAEEMKRDTTFTKMNKKAKAKLMDIESSRVKGLNEIGKTVSKTLKMEKEGLVTLSTAQKKQYNDIQRVTEGYKSHYKAIGIVKRGMSSLLGTIKKAGMIFLTVLGPLFLFGAALRTAQQFSDYTLGSFIKLEDALYELRKTAGISLKAMWEIGAELEHLTAIIPLSAEELGKIAATAGRLGIRGKENIIEFTKTVAMMATATELTADEAAQALGKLTAAFDIPIENVKYLGSVINELSNISASSAGDIVEAMKRVGAAGKLMGFTAEEVAAMSATLIDMGMAAERSGTRIRRLFTEMARKSQKMSEQMEIDAIEWSRLIEDNPNKALMQYLEYLKDLKPIERQTKAHEVFAKVGGFAAVSLAQNIETYREHLEIANREMAYGTSLIEEFGIAIGKTSAQLKILTSRTEIAQRAIGEDLIPVVIGATKAWGDFLMALSGSTYGMEYMRKGTNMTTTSILKLEEGIERSNKDLQGFSLNFWALIGAVTRTNRSFTANLALMRDFQKNWKSTLKSFLTGGIVTFEDLESAAGALETRFDTLDEATTNYRGGIGAVITVLKENKLLTKDLVEGEDKLFISYNKVDKARKHLTKTTDELSRLEKEEPENAEAIAKAEKEKAEAILYVDYIKKQAIKSTIQFGKEVYKASKKEIAADRVSERDISRLEMFIKFHEKLIPLFLEENDIGKERLTNLAVESAITTKNTKLWEKWTTVVSKANIKTIASIKDTSESSDYFIESLKEVGHTIEWIAGQPQIIPEKSIESIEETIKKTDKLLESTELLTYNISDLIQIEREREEILRAVNNLQDKLIRGSMSYSSLLFDEVNVETQIADSRKKAPPQIKSEIMAIDEKYREINRLIDADEEEAAGNIQRALAINIATEAENMLIDGIQGGERIRLKELKYLMDYIEYNNRGVGIDLDKVSALAEIAAGYVTLTESQIKAKDKIVDTNEIIKAMAKELGIVPSELEPISDLIGEAIMIPEIDTADLYELTANINEILEKIELPEINVEELKNILNIVQETADALPPVQIQIGIEKEYFITAWEKLKSEIEPLELKIKSTAGGSITSAQHGLSNVPETGLYKLHKNEEVIPAGSSRNRESKTYHLYFGGITLSSDYPANKFLRDVDDLSLTQI